MFFTKPSRFPLCFGEHEGGNTHAADEYLEIDSVVRAAQTLLIFVCQWCGASA
jgi:acetylornithine deacetylase/succinyl-diaminopimelate desuccinylase-like protein